MKITLRDVAEKAGVTISTVQRALNEGGGVSEAKRVFIKKVADELGYHRTIIHPGKKGHFRIAAIFPDTTQDNRFYTHHLWKGIDQYIDMYSTYNIELVPLTYRQLDEHILRAQEILDGCHGAVDGIVARGTSTSESSTQYRKMQESGIPVVLVGTDIISSHRLCCVKNYEQMAGSMAADMLIGFGVLTEGSRVIICGTFRGMNQFHNAQGFERQTWDSGLKIEILKIPNAENNDETKQSICAMLESNENITAIYACSARSTIAACNAIEQMGMTGKVRIIGSDLFQESINLLRNGQISALMHHRPYTLAYRSIEVLINYLANGKKQIADTILVNSEIVTKGNLDYFLRDIPSLEEFVDSERLALLR